MDTPHDPRASSLLRPFAASRPGLRLALVTLDAHLDVSEYDAASLSSGTPFRRALESGILTGARTAKLAARLLLEVLSARG
jgi:arginase family enzyme